MHDKKSDHVGNHGGAYVDNDGMSKQFTYVDHDVKTKIATTPSLSEKERMRLADEMKTYRTGLILKITISPPSLCPDIFQDFTLRGKERTNIEWNEQMLQDPGLPLQKLIDIWTLLSKRVESVRNTF